MKRRHKVTVTITTDKPIGTGDFTSLLNDTFRGNEEYVFDPRDVTEGRKVNVIRFGAFKAIGGRKPSRPRRPVLVL